VKMSTFSGDQIAQVNNPDPFAVPVWRSPVYHTPGWVITLVQLWRLVTGLVRFACRHPLLVLAALLIGGSWHLIGWPGPVVLAAVITAALALWWRFWPRSFTRHVLGRALGKWRRWHYQRHWAAVMTIGRLAPVYQGRLLLPVLGKVSSNPYTDRVLTGLVSGQCAEDFARRAENLATGFGAIICRVRTARPGFLVLEFVRRDALAAIIPALPIAPVTDLRALPVGRREDGTPWTIRLHGTHLLIAGATGAGKGSIVWGLIRALLPALHAGLARILAADPKVMELAYGRPIFDRYGLYAPTPTPS
jgi:S-DNA-T family DNA segregation ATPase FtsK/SpoIIIE